MSEDSRLRLFLDRMAAHFQIELAREDDLEAIVGLFRRAWKKKRTEAEIAERFRHRFRENPAASPGALLVCRSGGQLVGFAGMVDTEVDEGRRTVPAGFCVDLVVDERHRAAGVAQLLQRGLNARRDFVLEGNLNQEAKAVAVSMGARDIRGCTVLRRWSRPGDLFRWGSAVREVAAFDDGFDRLWEQAHKDYPRITRRDRAVLAWHYRKSPQRRFRIHVADQGGELAGYVVTTILPFVGPLRRGVVVDLLFSPFSTELAVSTVGAAVSGLVRRGAVCVDAVATNSDVRRAMEAGGFRATGHSPGFMLYDTPFTHGREELWQAESWYLTYGDSDFFL